MRGNVPKQTPMPALVPPESNVPESHPNPLRAAKRIADEVLLDLDRVFDEMCAAWVLRRAARAGPQGYGAGGTAQRMVRAALAMFSLSPPRRPGARMAGESAIEDGPPPELRRVDDDAAGRVVRAYLAAVPA